MSFFYCPPKSPRHNPRIIQSLLTTNAKKNSNPVSALPQPSIPPFRNTITRLLPIVHLDEFAIITLRSIIREFTHPNRADPRLHNQPLLRLSVVSWGLAEEDVTEKGFEDGHATAYQTGADFNSAVGGREKLA